MKRAPQHLRPLTKKWFNSVLKEYVLEEHHIKLLTLAAESWDRYQEAKDILNRDGIVFYNTAHMPRPHPCVKMENDNKIIFARLLRELALDIEGPEESRPPSQY